MWIRISNWIHAVSNGWVTLAALLIFLLFTALVLPGQSSKAVVETSGTGTPDLSFYYSGDELCQLAEAYGKVGRDAYVKTRFTFDLVWPVVYMCFLSTGISWIYQKSFAKDSILQQANLIPIFAAIFDYMENISTSVVMLRYPSPSILLANVAGVFTLVKWLLIVSSFTFLILGLVVMVWRWLRSEKRN